ncbi:class Ib ribonucleoside-diphosphate reductase assembly flavoprotein NrdI [uncultured Deinococcus sp.]|uniref:class Ib ribonucleoside-diphosphate reductase assembly flavoprotein NrdI n=1 Tax=uncultured Deinococcus sp. TaxID=158789 RepID=UPI00258F89BF|nr:class Ib ribonucleoside-diphosphate reductase assembly flavoprotein NrdI [uncultured Deinococcus sp.]
MLLAFDSLTGNVRRFVGGVQAALPDCALDAQPVQAAQPTEDFVLFTYTFGTGQVPATTARFLEQHGGRLRGVVSSGSFHWGDNFGRAGDLIAARYGVPLIAKINKGGTAQDRETVAAWLRDWEEGRAQA